jgi:hypothetical protein
VRDLRHAIVLAASADAEEIRTAYWNAVADGALNTGSCPDCERGHGALRLLTLAILRLPDLSVQAHLLDAGPCPVDGILDFVLEAVCDTSAGALRLTHRALEAHAGALGYDAFAWVEHAVRRAGAVLRDLEPALIEGTTAGAQVQARQVAVALTRAVAATDADWMGVPDHIATALAHLLTLFMIADEAIDT